MRKILLGLLVTAPLLATPAYADTKTGNLSVTATVLKSCSISSTQTLAFGEVTDTTNNIENQGSLTFTCTDTTPYFVSAGAGANALSGQRRMASQTLATTAYLTYDIYADQNRTIPFPTSAPETIDGAAGAAGTGGTGSGDPKTLTVFGRIPAGAHLPAPDNYLDTVVMTVTY